MNFHRFASRATLVCASFLLLTACAGTGVIVPSHQDPNAVAGTINGSGVVNGGNATYTINLDLPPGRAQVAPALALTYNSRAGNGLIGMGWTLNGATSIFRCPAAVGPDGYSSSVRLNSGDRLCIGGLHLVATHGEYGKSGSVYHTEIESLIQVELVGDTNRPDSYFVVTTANGGKMYLRKALLVPGATVPLSWSETLFEDLNGNTVEHRYDDSAPGQLLISQILYTGRDLNDKLTSGTRIVRFNYEARPDVSVTYVAGAQLRETRRLKSIVISMPLDSANQATATTVREYDLSYVQSEASGRSLLTSLKECGYQNNGARPCLPTTRFTWENEALAYGKPAVYNLPALDANLTPSQFVDATSVHLSPYFATGNFDGDGRQELLYYRPGVGAHLYLLNADGSLRKDIDVGKFFQTSSDAIFQSFTADVNNDGADDLPGNVGGRLAFASWDGDDLGKPVDTGIPYSADMAVADMDGDGHADIIQAEPLRPGSKDYALFLYRNLGSKPGKFAFAPRQLICTIKNFESRSENQRGSFGVMGGISGSGLPDVVIFSDDRIEQVISTRQNPDKTLRFDVTTPAALGMVDRSFREQTYFADINGDGLMDIVYADAATGAQRTWWYQINSGGHFLPPVNTGVADERPAGVGEVSTLVGKLRYGNADAVIYPDKLIVPYCMGATHILPNGQDAGQYTCSAQLDKQEPWNDFGIYQYAVMKFELASDGSFVPRVNHETGIVSQANLTSLGDLHGFGVAEVFAPFSPWFANGHFQDAAGKMTTCPAQFGCGFHISSPTVEQRPFGLDVAQDLITTVTNGFGGRLQWDYYSMSSPKPGLYRTKPVGSAARYIDNGRKYFATTSYIVGAYDESLSAGSNPIHHEMQYGNAVYDNSGRGMAGFRWMIDTGGVPSVKTTIIYGQKFPMFGSLLAIWGDSSNLTGDNLDAGTPDPARNGYEVTYTFDCAGPSGSTDLAGKPCSSSPLGTYAPRIRHKIEHGYDAKLQSRVDTDSEFEYDGFGNVVHTIVKTHDSTKDKITEVTGSYAAPDIGAWRINKLVESKTQASTTELGKDKVTTNEDDQFESNDRRAYTREVIRNGKPYIEIRTDTYREDTTAADYGELIAKGDTKTNASDGSTEEANTIHVTYSPDGYFGTDYKTVNGAEEIYEYDPITGKHTKEVKNGATTLYTYDLVGRIVSMQVSQPGKPTVLLSGVFAACDQSCPKGAAYYMTLKRDGTAVKTSWYDAHNQEVK